MILLQPEVEATLPPLVRLVRRFMKSKEAEQDEDR